MENQFFIAQDNKLTSARYELSLIEKKIVYKIIQAVRKKYIDSNTGQKDLFDDLVVRFPKTDLEKTISEDNKKVIKNGLKKLRYRSLEIDTEEHWLEVGFINYSKWKKDTGSVEIQVSKKILPYLVELSKNFTSYSVTVALSLKSQWSQRLYELCSQWKNAGGFKTSVHELRHIFKLENKYKEYGSLKKFVLETAYKELKELYQKRESDLYFEYSEIKNGSLNKRSVTDLRFKVISKVSEKDNLLEKRLTVLKVLSVLFPGNEITKNYKFRSNAIKKCEFEPPLMDLLYSKIIFCNEKEFNDIDMAKYIRFIINEEILKGL